MEYFCQVLFADDTVNIRHKIAHCSLIVHYTSSFTTLQILGTNKLTKESKLKYFPQVLTNLG